MDQKTDSLSAEIADFDAATEAEASKTLSSLVRTDDLVGDLLKMDFAECEVLIHDYLRQKVGGLPLGCFLLATRMEPSSSPPARDEDSGLLLLRVVGQARLPNAAETDLSRFLAGQRAAADNEVWDAEGKTDQFTLHQLRYAGIKCRVLGTYRMRENASDRWSLSFGADVSNFYSGRGLKVYKPVGASLTEIVNFSKAVDAHTLAGKRVPVGRVRYASSERFVDPEGENVEVTIDPTDLIARRTALFGMSRTGKSNTTKVIAASVFGLRTTDPAKARVGQLIFDVNGEYANENTQDGGTENPTCLKNVGPHTNGAKDDDVVTYGLWPHPNDPDRKIVKINFFGESLSRWLDREKVIFALDSLFVGKTLVDAELSEYGDKYIKSFETTSLEPPKEWNASSQTRYQRLILAYRSALAAANFRPPPSLAQVRFKGLFNEKLRKALAQSTSTDGNDSVLYVETASILSKDSGSWEEAVRAMQGLRRFMEDKTSGFQAFNSGYMDDHDGRSWADPSFVNILEIFKYPNGVRAIVPVGQSHDPSIKGDFAREIVDDLLKGRLVIFDQSLGDPEQNKQASERIMWAIFNRQKQSFVVPEKDDSGAIMAPPDLLVYAEEAHNLLPANSALDTNNIWSRVAKEGSKYRIGFIYATQEPSSIQANIMKNTDNWFVAHLNNSDETKRIKEIL
jgi:Helicase HerA, central domain